MLLRPRHCSSFWFCLVVAMQTVITTTRMATTHALTLPRTRQRHDGNRKQAPPPRLAVAAGQAVAWTARALLLGTKVERTTVHVQATSNRQVWWQGRLDGLEVTLTNLRGPAVHLTELHLQAPKGVSLGKWPLVCLTLPIVLWKVQKRLAPVMLWIGLFYCLSQLQKSSSPSINSQRNKNNDKKQSATMTWMKSIRQRYLDGPQWTLDYRLVLSSDNLQASRMLQWGLRAVLRSLMLNSVLGVAAATADGTMAIMEQEQKQKRNKRDDEYGTLVKLPSGKVRRLPYVLDDKDKNEKGNPQTPTPPTPLPPIVEPRLTQLLQATDFVLNRATLMAPDMLVFNATAVLPDDETSSFSYMLRVSLYLMHKEHNNALLVFGSPTCRFQTSALLAEPAAAAWKRFLPDVWIPVGPGVAVPMPLVVRQICVTADRDVEMSGRLIGPSQKDADFGMQVWNALQGQGPLPFSTKGRPPALPPSK